MKFLEKTFWVSLIFVASMLIFASITCGATLLISFIVWDWNWDALALTARIGLSLGFVIALVYCLDTKDGLTTWSGWPR